MSRTPLLLVFALGCSLPCFGLDRESGCGRIPVLADIEVHEGKFSLADLLSPAACPEQRQLASLISLGWAPLPGSVRVFTGEEIRDRFESGLRSKTKEKNNKDKNKANAKDADQRWKLQLPDRITVRRAGGLASCSDIVESISGSSDSLQASASAGSVSDANCGAAGRIRRDAALAVARTRWNASRGTLEITARCLQPTDCNPFLVSGPLDSMPQGLAQQPKSGLLRASSKTSMVMPGQRMTLLWDQDGIQMILRVISLDRGNSGEVVRARVQPGDRVLRATVVDAATLRMHL
jgi:hypothetical protein